MNDNHNKSANPYWSGGFAKMEFHPFPNLRRKAIDAFDYFYDKMLFHPFINFISWSISCSVMSAVNEKRMREVPSGTVGGRTGNA